MKLNDIVLNDLTARWVKNGIHPSTLMFAIWSTLVVPIAYIVGLILSPSTLMVQVCIGVGFAWGLVYAIIKMAFGDSIQKHKEAMRLVKKHGLNNCDDFDKLMTRAREISVMLACDVLRAKGTSGYGETEDLLDEFVEVFGIDGFDLLLPKWDIFSKAKRRVGIIE